MTNSMKNTLRSVVALSSIAVICVALLALANAFIPKYKPSLDLATVTLINEIVPTGTDAQTAFDDGYFEMADIDEKALSNFNKENRFDTNNAVLAVYNVVKGSLEGCFVIETQAMAHNAAAVLLTAFNAEGNIIGITVKSHSDDLSGYKSIFEDGTMAKLNEYAKTVRTFTGSEIEAATGATTSNSVRGVTNALTIAVKAADRLVEKGGKL